MDSDFYVKPAPRPLKIGYVWQYEASQAHPNSATALHIKAVIGGLQRRGHHVRLVAVRHGRPQWTEDLVTWQPVDGISPAPAGLRQVERLVRGVQGRLGLPYFRLFESDRFGRACAAALADRDLLYERFWMTASGGLMAARRLGLSLVYEVNGDLVEEYDLLGIKLPPGQWAANHFVIRRMFARAARVVTVSETLRQRVIDRWRVPAGRVTTVDNGADVELFGSPVSLLPAEPQRRRQAGEQVVVFVGSFKPWHGLDLLVEAFARVASSNPSARLVFVGDGPVRPDLEQQAQSLGLDGAVRFLGLTPHAEVAPLLAAADVAVLNPRLSPAALSQSPLKLFEYMSAGKAIVAPDMSNVRRVLADRQTGLLVPPNDAGALAAAIQELLGDEPLRCALGQAARRQALSSHSWDQTVEKLEAIFYAELERRR